MNDVQEIADLRPAPRQASALVLWTMTAVVIGGIGCLAGRRAESTAATAASPVTAERTSAYRLAIAVHRPVPASAPGRRN